MANDTAKMALAPQPTLGRCAVQVEHDFVHTGLVVRILPKQRLADFAVDVSHGLTHALAAVAFRIVIAQLERFATAGGSAGGHGGATARAGLEDDVGFHGGVATRIEYFARPDIGNDRHIVV